MLFHGNEIDHHKATKWKLNRIWYPVKQEQDLNNFCGENNVKIKLILSLTGVTGSKARRTTQDRTHPKNYCVAV